MRTIDVGLQWCVNLGGQFANPVVAPQRLSSAKHGGRQPRQTAHFCRAAIDRIESAHGLDLAARAAARGQRNPIAANQPPAKLVSPERNFDAEVSAEAASPQADFLPTQCSEGTFTDHIGAQSS